ncbi:MAG: SUMF1/EgtB/PvdO family nonheme iron enzyme [Cyanobacteria bacterium P01_H01_bin.105]
MVRIFLAHAKEDKAEVVELYERLKRRGYTPWLDKKDLLAGQTWRAEIPKAIRNSDIFIACLSKHSVEKQGYVQQEFRMALNQCARRPPGKIYLVPVRLDDCNIPDLRQEEYGINLRDYQWVDLFEPDGFEQLVQSVDYHFPGDNSGQGSDGSNTVIQEGPPTVLQTPIPEESSKETQKGEEPVVIIQEGPKYDLRGAQFAGGFAETVLGNQVGGTIRNDLPKPSEPSTPESSRPPIETKAIDLGNGVTLELVYIPSGKFLMGSSEQEGRMDEKPQHKVTVPEIWMGKYPVTKAQYEAVMGKNPNHFSGASNPIEQVSWSDAIAFCEKASQNTGIAFRLPSEAEWEYACRAGTTTPYFFGDDLTSEQANFGCTEGALSPVGSYLPNSFGLYDMHGNVWEWCLDHRHQNYKGAPNDGSAWISDNDSSYRIMRGGTWALNPNDCRSARRFVSYLNDCGNSFGFRVVSAPPGYLQ